MDIETGAISKLPIRQITLTLILWNKLVISKLPIRQITARNKKRDERSDF